MKRTFTKYPSSYVSASSEKTYEFVVKRCDDSSFGGKIETLHAKSWQEAVDILNEDDTVEWWQTLRD
jgi:hypothetical protein